MTETAPPPLAGRQFLLRPLQPDDLAELYRWAVEPPTSSTWRFRGKMPSPESFPNLIWSGVLTQFAIAPRSAPRSAVGIVQAFNHDAENRLLYVSLCVSPALQSASRAAGEGIALFLRHLFATFDLRKVYLELHEAALPRTDLSLQRYPVVLEGRLRDHLFHCGGFVDLLVLAVHAQAFHDFLPQLDSLLSPTPERSGPRVDDVGFEEFVAAIPSDLLDLPAGRQVSGGFDLVEDGGLDSLSLLELIAWIEDGYGPVSRDRLEIRTLQDLFAAAEAAHRDA